MEGVLIIPTPPHEGRPVADFGLKLDRPGDVEMNMKFRGVKKKVARRYGWSGQGTSLIVSPGGGGWLCRACTDDWESHVRYVKE